ncbi:hypothetical protein IFM89_021049 [Coptis chinensis]|uniref:F-box associated beta-propeller type 1 domain-containing protein n=1 Tax=Coptis chinensis TaxID=261450 RepID=A0A835HA91_9MAGN|nr:hypothetical protein IFM89_021049 [Coptis chinensis]
MYLWNTYTREYKRIPNSNSSTKNVRAAFGFGYNDTTKDYQVVRIVSFCDENCHSEVEVYSLGENLWRRIEDIPYKISEEKVTGKLVSGAVHWIATRSNKSLRSPRIGIAYDIKGEKFREVPLPSPLPGYESACLLNINITTLEGCLCVLLHYSGFVHGWIMEDYGNWGSWSLLFHIGARAPYRFNIDTDVLAPLSFRVGAILLSDQNHLYLYDKVSYSVIRVKIENLPKRHLRAVKL